MGEEDLISVRIPVKMSQEDVYFTLQCSLKATQFSSTNRKDLEGECVWQFFLP